MTDLTIDVGIDWVHIPRGTYTPGEPGAGREPVTVGPFWAARVPVTVGQYRALRQVPLQPSWSTASNFPVVHVTQADCKSFAELLGPGVRLPTADESEYASRGVDGRTYPWGNEAPDDTRLVWRDTQARPVGKKPAGASPFGLLDCAGNVWEWCAGYLVRGGSWGGTDPSNFRCAYRYGNGPGSVNGYQGFRVVRDTDPGDTESEWAEAAADARGQPAGAAWADLLGGARAREKPFRCPCCDGWGTRPARDGAAGAEGRMVTCPSCVDGIVWGSI